MVAAAISDHAARMKQMVAPGNHGIGKPEVLPGNIGYLEVHSFLGRGPGVEEAIASAIARALQLIRAS